MRLRFPMFVLAALLAGAALPADAGSAYDGHTREERIVGSAAFLWAHPDVKHRRIALAAYDEGKLAIAFRRFRQAARYADKPSQAMLAEMLWRGEGVPRDRAAAYAWMDLAAERSFKVMLAKREHYWNALTATERNDALRIGNALFADYGDHVAKRRLERKLRRARYERTGSNVGFVGRLDVTLNVENEPVKVTGRTYYDEMFWDPERYWAWADEEWRDPAGGVVDIGPLRTSPGE